MAANATEGSTVQAGIVDRISRVHGWKHVPGKKLKRGHSDVLLEDDVRAALLKLNPKIAEKPERADEVLVKLRRDILQAVPEGAMPVNRRLYEWMRGAVSVRFIGEQHETPIRLIDFDDPAQNSYIVADEIVIETATDRRRFDILLYVNGIPVVDGETKTPFNEKVSWLDAAGDICNVYRPHFPQFYAANLFSFACDGRDFRYGALGASPEKWVPWGATDGSLDKLAPLARALKMAEMMLAPAVILEIIRCLTLFSVDQVGDRTNVVKIIPRYQQYESAHALARRVLDGRKKGLLWQHQGAGKTHTMSFACMLLRYMKELRNPTIVIVLDRIDLIDQTSAELRSAGVPQLREAGTKEQLRKALSNATPGVIITTIFRFKDAGQLSDDEMIVMVDEAHRTQHGSLGMDMRLALPNATFIGLTGTPVVTTRRDTFDLFGHEDDPESTLVHYSVGRAEADGIVCPIAVEPRLVNLHLNKSQIDAAFDELADEEALEEGEKERLARRSLSSLTIMKMPGRVEAVCRDFVEHYRERIAPLGMKAMVVAADRELCVLYQHEIERLLGESEESAVVMTVNEKDIDPRFLKHQLDRAAEARLKARFKNVDDPLKFLIVTSKLLTGFDAPVCGVMYLDKPMKAHTLTQAIARTNRRWTNPHTGQQKSHGLVVDYVGLGEEIAAAIQPPERRSGPKQDTTSLREQLIQEIETASSRFDGIDPTLSDFEQLLEAQQRVHDAGDQHEFAKQFLFIQRLFELLWPHRDLKPVRDKYKWLAKIYRSMSDVAVPDALLWQRLGAKTFALIADAVEGVDISSDDATLIPLAALERLRGMIKFVEGSGEDGEVPSNDELVRGIIAKIDKVLRAKGSKDPVYHSLAERLDALRKAQVQEAKASIIFLKELLALATTVAGFEHDQEPEEETDPVGALTQLFYEVRPDETPDIVERVVLEIDAVVKIVRFSGWQNSSEKREVKIAIRNALKKFGLPPTGDLFDRTYAYVAENY